MGKEALTILAGHDMSLVKPSSRAQSWKENTRDLWIASAFGTSCSWVTFSVLGGIVPEDVIRMNTYHVGRNPACWVLGIAAAIVGGAVAEFLVTSWQKTTSSVITLALIVQMSGRFIGLGAGTFDREHILTALFLFVSAMFGHCVTRSVFRE
jgi:hypothetical protein